MPEEPSVLVENGLQYARFISNISNAMKSPRHRGRLKADAAAETADAINRHLGTRVKELRTARGWSLESLANASGVSRSNANGRTRLWR